MVSQSDIFVVKQGWSLAWETPTAKRPPGKIQTRKITIKIWTNLNLKTHKTNTRPTTLKQVRELLQGQNQSHDQTKTGTNLRTRSETRGTNENEPMMRRLNLFRLFESIRARNRDGKEKSDLWVKVRKRLNQLVSFFQQDFDLQLSEHKKLAQSVWLALISLSITGQWVGLKVTDGWVTLHRLETVAETQRSLVNWPLPEHFLIALHRQHNNKTACPDILFYLLWRMMITFLSDGFLRFHLVTRIVSKKNFALVWSESLFCPCFCFFSFFLWNIFSVFTSCQKVSEELL